MLKFCKLHGQINLISRSTTIATKSRVCPAETQISMHSALVQFDQSLLGALCVAKDPVSSRVQQRLIRMRGCTDLAESSLGAHTML